MTEAIQIYKMAYKSMAKYRSFFSFGKFDLEYEIDQITKPEIGLLYAYLKLEDLLRFGFYSNLTSVRILQCNTSIVLADPKIMPVPDINCSAGQVEYFWEHFFENDQFPEKVEDINVLDAPRGTVLCRWIEPIQEIGVISGLMTDGFNSMPENILRKFALDKPIELV